MEILTIKIKKSSEIISCTINGKKSNNNEQYKTGGTQNNATFIYNIYFFM